MWRYGLFLTFFVHIIHEKKVETCFSDTSTMYFRLLMEKGYHWLLRSWAPVISIPK